MKNNKIAFNFAIEKSALDNHHYSMVNESK